MLFLSYVFFQRSYAENKRTPSLSESWLQVTVHNPDDVPLFLDPKLPPATVRASSEEPTGILLEFKPTIKEHSEELKSYPVVDRQCLFPHETKLLVNNKYSQHNCLFECKVMISKKICGCVPWFIGIGDNWNKCDLIGTVLLLSS